MSAIKSSDWSRDQGVFDQLLEALNRESDRGVLLMCLGYIDERLEVLMKTSFSCFPGREKVARGLLAFPGPLSTLSSRLNLAYCMGLIGDGERSAIEAMRKTRNEAAHGFAPFSLSDRSTADRLASIPPVREGESPLEWVRARQVAGQLPEDQSREWRFVFLAATSHVAGVLRAYI